MSSLLSLIRCQSKIKGSAKTISNLEQENLQLKMKLEEYEAKKEQMPEPAENERMTSTS